MGSSYALFGYPTFTQGLILGQFSVLLCLALLIKYLFLAPTESPFETSSYHTKVDRDPSREPIYLAENTKEKDLNALPESAEWLSILLRQASRTDYYRTA
jgi:maintenance of morphology protein 1